MARLQDEEEDRSSHEDMRVRPPPIEVLAAEGFAQPQNSQFATRVPSSTKSATASLGLSLLAECLSPQSTPFVRPASTGQELPPGPVLTRSVSCGFGSVAPTASLSLARPLGRSPTASLQLLPSQKCGSSIARPAFCRTRTAPALSLLGAAGEAITQPTLRRVVSSETGTCVVPSSLQKGDARCAPSDRQAVPPQPQLLRQSSITRTNAADCCGVPPQLMRQGSVEACTPQVVHQSSGARCNPLAVPQVSPARPALLLPVPLRGTAITATRNVPLPGSPHDIAERPVVSTMLYGQSRRLHAAKAKTLPPRLQAVDDQTAIPKEVYGRMMQLGGEARGYLGYGQHRLQFVGPNGTRTLKLMDCTSSHCSCTAR